MSSYLPWQAALGPSVEVCAVQLPGRGARLLEPRSDSFDALIDTLTRLVETESDRPFVLFGHSLGALMAFEVTRSLRARAAPLPAKLMISACEAPHVRTLGRRLHELDDTGLTAALRELNGTSEQVLNNQELMHLVLPAIRADFAMNAEYAYRPQPPLHVPMVVFAGEDDAHVEIGRVRQWDALTQVACGFHALPGGHFFIDTQRPMFMSLLKPLLLALAADVKFNQR